MRSLYEIIHICTAVVDESEEWSSQLIFQFKLLERRSLKKSGLQRDSNPWPPRYRCDALPTELWSHTLGARSVYWVHIFPCSEMMRSLYEIIHICTAVVDESEEWSSQLIFQFKHQFKQFQAISSTTAVLICPRTQDNVPGQGSNPDPSLRSRAH